MKLKSPLMLALDVDKREDAERLADELGEYAGALKLGPRLVYRYGESFVRSMAKRAPIFIDCKFFDIPSTMVASVRAAFEAGASFATVHAMAGPEALSQLARLEEELNRERPFKILCVTILTSWDETQFSANFTKKPVLDHVRILAEQVLQSGLRGLVCSPHELNALRGKGLYLVTPGVRLGTEKADDQKRTMDPHAALAEGASAFVVGRPIIAAADPVAAAKLYK